MSKVCAFWMLMGYYYGEDEDEDEDELSQLGS